MEKGLREFLSEIKADGMDYAIGVNLGTYKSHIQDAIKQVLHETVVIGENWWTPSILAGGGKLYIVDMDQKYFNERIVQRRFRGVYILEQASRHDNVAKLLSRL